MLTLDQDVAFVRLGPGRVKYVHIQKQDLGAGVSPADLVVFRLQRPIPLDCIDVLGIPRTALV